MIKRTASKFIYAIVLISCTTTSGVQDAVQTDSVVPQNDDQMHTVQPSDAFPSTEAQPDSSVRPQNSSDSQVVPGVDSSDRVLIDPRENSDAVFTDAMTASDGRTQQTVDATPVVDSTTSLGPCDHACLVGFLDEYLNALIAHDPSALKVAPDLRATEDGKDITLGDGIWTTATVLRSFREDFVDVVQGQAGSFVVLEESGRPALMTLRLKVVDRQITEVETIVSRTGAHMFFAPNNLVTADPIFDEIVPEPERSSREDLDRLANAYFDGLESGNGSALVFDAQCRRLENGVVAASGTGIGNGFVMFSYIEEVKRRVVIVDEERGLAFGLAVFEIPSQGRSTFVAELFKIVDGRFRMIHAFLLNMPFGTASGW